jgi:serine/threonine protein kinase/WD40 repeat protein
LTRDQSQPDFEDELLAGFLQELEATADRSAVVRAFAHRHPALADELARLEEMNRLVARAGDEESLGGAPRQLGEFRIIRRIARGGMGDIYEAVQDRLNRRVAVKTIRRGRISPQARGRFFREQRVLARLHQTHIVPIHSAGEDGDLLYFVMPFIDGASLNHVVRAATELDTRGPGSKAPSLAALALDVVQAPAGPSQLLDGKSAPQKMQSTLPRRALSVDYFRSVANVMADTAEAIEHAHRMNILHRDLKPSNILIDRQGQCWIIDFGLAGFVGQVSDTNAESLRDDGEALTTAGILGTPQYMSPEQWRGEPTGVRSDVWGLGATLYELLTLRRAFDGPSDMDAQERILSDEPLPPRSIVRNVPADLAAVCRKALHKQPDERYSTAQAFADDLRRWLRHEPVSARPARVLRRVALWAKRNRGWAAAMVFTLIGLSAVLGLEIRRERQQAEDAVRETEMQKLQRGRLESHANGWRDWGWMAAKNIHALRPDSKVTNEAAALLVGCDANAILTLPFGASSVVIDQDGKRLLVGGLNNTAGEPVSGPRMIDVADGSIWTSLGPKGAGPVTFRANSVTLQLVPKDAGIVALWDVRRQTVIREFSLDPEAVANSVTGFNYPVLALSADGLRAAAATHRRDGHDKVIVWNTITGRQLGEWERSATSLALTDDGTIIAIGEEEGMITVESLDNSALRLRLDGGALAITALAFGHDPTCRNDNSIPSWRLASGDAGTRITVWDLRTGQHRCHCDGSAHGITCLAFNPDGMTLASADRNVRLWDAATGRHILDIEIGNIIAGLGFDSAGRRLAICNPTPSPAINPNSQIQVFDLEAGRGTMTLSGLFGPVRKSVFSNNGELVAAISDQWQVAIWNLKLHRLLYVFDGLRGEYVDNAALAFDAAGTRLACAGDRQFKLWDVASGRTLRSLNLPPGLQNTLAFSSTGQELWSVRCETATGVAPHAHANLKDHPRMYPVRNLLGVDPVNPTPIAKMPNEHPMQIAVTLDGTTVVINSKRKEGGQDRYTVRAFSLPAATLLWSVQSSTGGLDMDPLGKSVGSDLGSQGMVALDISSGTIIRKVDRNFGPVGSWWLRGDHQSLGVGEDELADIDIDREHNTLQKFSPCGRYFAVGRPNGSVVIYELEAFRRKLVEFKNP